MADINERKCMQMFFRILKKDLRRNRAMNVILLVFVLLSAMFVSSSASNILTLLTAQEDYFEMAGMSDYIIITKGIERDELGEAVESTGCADSFIVEPLIFLSEDDATIGGEKIENTPNLCLYSFEESALTYFTLENEPVTSLSRGEILLPSKLRNTLEINVGDVFALTLGETKKEFKVAGFVKDAMFGSTHVSSTRCLIAKSDFDEIYREPLVKEQQRAGAFASVFTADSKSFANAFMKSKISTILVADRGTINSMYVLDLAVSGVLLVVSIGLVLIAIVVLRFTINFTLSREWREIGVMKAVGISNSRIRGLYLVKYLAVSVFGAILGFFAGIPFGTLLLESASENMVIENESMYFVNVICAILVVVAVMGFCWGGTKRIKTLSPVSAVRDGTEGERFSRKSILSLSKSSMRPVAFLALNDILSSVKRYATMIVAFTLCLVFTLVTVNTISTLQSEELLEYFGTIKSDVYLINSGYVDYFEENGRKNMQRDFAEMEGVLEDEGMPGEVVGEIYIFSTLDAGENSFAGMLFQGNGTTVDEYAYSQGSAPQKTDEVAITSMVAEALDISIGDTFTYTDMDEKREVIVTGIFQSMMNMGNGVRLHEDAKINYSQAAGFNAYQIIFDDKCEKEEIERRMARLAEIYPDYRVMTGGEYADYFTGSSAMVAGVRNLLVPVLIIVCMLIAILMERSFIAREQGQIAMLRASGFTKGFVVRWHTLRMAFVLLISTVIGVALSTPVTQLLITPVFNLMGADTISYKINPLEAFVVYPLIFMVSTLVAVFFAAQSTKKITASQTSSIE